MPAEWEPHDAVWLSWPHDTTSFPYLEEAEAAFASFIREIHRSERVELLVLDEAMKERVVAMLGVRRVDLSRIRFHIHDYADIWFRDYGPIFVVCRESRQLAMTKWIFNAWGNKYESLLKDNIVPYFMKESLRLPIFEPGIVMEGGSIEVNGCGTLLTTKQCLLHPNRNPNLSREEIEMYLSDYLGVRHFIWLREGIAGDDTDGHIDDIARFVNPTTVLCARQPDESDPDHAVLKETFRLLEAATDQDGNKLRVIPLPVPGWVGDDQGRLPASYANFYIGNTKVLVPLFDAENDAEAMEVIQSVFPDRKVVGINARYLLYGLGTFHCMTQQQPTA
ncbi:MAG: agmatine deiminase family protein [Acidobacteria bacterium]|nr:agmatine deiminase family protein [Acidobacteriota bacterium]